MPQKNAQDRLWKILTPVLLVLAVLAMAKTLFVGLEIDEEYAFSLGFRLVKGDRLFYTMWEPHQLSALPAALVLALYTAIAGTTTGALLFVRAVVLVCKAAMSAVFYRDFKQTIGRHGALLSAVVLFVYTPKWFLGPDYISQQFHFTVAAFLCFYHYYTHGFRRPWLVVLGAVCACFSFLAFPQSALAAAVIFIGMVLLGRRGKEPTICKIPRGAVLFVLGCMACAAAFLAYVLPGMGLTVFLQRVSLILNDPQYDFTTSQRLALLASQALNTAKFLAKPLAASVVLCLLWWAKTRQKRDWTGLALNLWAILAALLCVVRAVADSSSDERYFMPALVLAVSVAGSNITVLVYIEFADLYFSVVLLSELFDHRSHHTARAAPCRKEIHNYRDIGSQNINIKICACKYCFHIIFSFHNILLHSKLFRRIRLPLRRSQKTSLPRLFFLSAADNIICLVKTFPDPDNFPIQFHLVAGCL